jgi:hypothetical protein
MRWWLCFCCDYVYVPVSSIMCLLFLVCMSYCHEERKVYKHFLSFESVVCKCSWKQLYRVVVKAFLLGIWIEVSAWLWTCVSCLWKGFVLLVAAKYLVLPSQGFVYYHYEVWDSATQKDMLDREILPLFVCTTKIEVKWSQYMSWRSFVWEEV